MELLSRRNKDLVKYFNLCYLIYLKQYFYLETKNVSIIMERPNKKKMGSS